MFNLIYSLKGNFFKFLMGSTLILLFVSDSLAQTTTTYTYDGQGRMINATNNTGNATVITFDDAGNIIEAISNNAGSSSNLPPTCSNVQEDTNSASATFDGVDGCSDADGGSLSITSITNPSGAATASVDPSNNTITFSNLQCGVNAIATRTVSDNQGGSVSSEFNVVRICWGGF